MKCLVCALVMGVLFFALTPGVLLTIPPSPIPQGMSCKYDGWVVQLGTDKYAGGCATSWAAAGVHAAVFAVLAFILCWFTCDRM